MFTTAWSRFRKFSLCPSIMAFFTGSPPVFELAVFASTTQNYHESVYIISTVLWKRNFIFKACKNALWNIIFHKSLSLGVLFKENNFYYVPESACPYHLQFFRIPGSIRLRKLDSHIGRGGHFGRGASLYRYRSQLFWRLWVRLLLPTGQFSDWDLVLGVYCRLRTARCEIKGCGFCRSWNCDR